MGQCTRYDLHHGSIISNSLVHNCKQAKGKLSVSSTVLTAAVTVAHATRSTKTIFEDSGTLGSRIFERKVILRRRVKQNRTVMDSSFLERGK